MTFMEMRNERFHILLCCGDGAILNSCAKYSGGMAANLLTLFLHSVIFCKSTIPFCSSHCPPIKYLLESFLNQMSFSRALAVFFFFLKSRVTFPTKECSSTRHPCTRESQSCPDPFNPEYNNRMLHYSSSSTPTPSARSQGRTAWHMTTMRTIVRQDCHSNPVILMSDSHR